MFEIFTNLCTPVWIYIILVIVQIIFSTIIFGNLFINQIISQFLITIVMIWLIQYLCTSGHKTISYIFVFVIVILSVIVNLFFFETNKIINLKKLNEQIKKK
jgi:hypothetical protein